MTHHRPRSIHLPYSVDEAGDRNHFFENHWKRVALDLLKSHAGVLDGLSLLDYGCGRGETLEYATAYGIKPCGLDVDPECVRIARSKGDAELLNLADPASQVGVASFDVVTCFHVLEHVDNPKEVLTMLGRAARRYVLTAVPNLRLISNLRKPRVESGRVNEGHLQSWDHAHFRNLAENHCGLRIISWGFDATILPVVSELCKRVFGVKTLLKLETGLFKRWFPFNGNSVIALMEPTVEAPDQQRIP
ncbi:MAG: class I SAM-dependent methyltransferase [Verrucomicrobia bacterium]|nr:class I SAM-dependent methyltransferase [Verrucomicrobiota bacterium]